MPRSKYLDIYYLLGVPEKNSVGNEDPPRTPWQRVWRGLVGEFLGTMFLTWFCCGSAVAATQFVPSSAGVLLIGLIQGFAVIALVSALRHISGGHINPAVTTALLFAGRMPILRAPLYIFVQCCGAIVGAGILKGAIPNAREHNLGATTPNNCSEFQAWLIEFFVVCAFTFVVLGTAADTNSSRFVIMAPIPIGLALGIGVLMANPWTGGSLNPARSLGPAVVEGVWQDFWVYWAGPLGAAMVVGLVYRFVFLTGPPTEEEVAYVRAKQTRHEGYYRQSVGKESALPLSPLNLQSPLDGTGVPVAGRPVGA